MPSLSRSAETVQLNKVRLSSVKGFLKPKTAPFLLGLQASGLAPQCVASPSPESTPFPVAFVLLSLVSSRTDRPGPG